MAQKSATGIRSGFLLRSSTSKNPGDEPMSPAEPAEDKDELCLPPAEPRDCFRMSSLAEISYTRVAASMSRPLYPSKQKKCEKELPPTKDTAQPEIKTRTASLPTTTTTAKTVETQPAAEPEKMKEIEAVDCTDCHPPDPKHPKIEDPALPEILPGLEPEDSTERIEIKSMADLENCIERFKVECGVGQKKTPVRKEKKEKKKKPAKKEPKPENSAEKSSKTEKNKLPPATPLAPEPEPGKEETPAVKKEVPKAEITFTCGICGKEIQQGKYEFFEYSCGQDYGYEVCTFKTHKNCLNEKYKVRNPALKDKTLWKNEECVTDGCKELLLCVNLVHVNGTKKIYIKSDPPKKKDAQKEHEMKKLEKKSTKNEEKRKAKKNSHQEPKQPPSQAQETLILQQKEPKPVRPILSLAPRVAPTPQPETPSPLRRMAVPIRTVHLSKKKDETEEKYFVQPASPSRPQKTKKQKQLINIAVGLPYLQAPFTTGGFEEDPEPRTVIPDSWDSGSEPEGFYHHQEPTIESLVKPPPPLPAPNISTPEPEYEVDEFPFEINSRLTYPYPGTPESLEYQQRIIRSLEPLTEDIVANCPNSVYGTTEPISKLQKAIELLLAISPGLIEPAQALYLKTLFESDEAGPLQHLVHGLNYFTLYRYQDGWYFCKNEKGRKLEQYLCQQPPPTVRQPRELPSYANSKSPFNASFLDQAEKDSSCFESASLSYTDRAVQPPVRSYHQPAAALGSSSEILVDAVNVALAASTQDHEEEMNRCHYHQQSLDASSIIDPSQQSMYGDYVSPANDSMPGGVSPSFEDRWHELTREDSSCSDKNQYLGTCQNSTAVGSHDWQPADESHSSGTAASRSPTEKYKDPRVKEYEKMIRTLQYQVTAEIEQNEIHQDLVKTLEGEIDGWKLEAGRKEEQHRQELELLQMRLNEQDLQYRSLQGQLQENELQKTIREHLFNERRDLYWIQNSLSHLIIIIEALKPGKLPPNRQLNHSYFVELKDRYLEIEQVHLQNIEILESGSANIRTDIPVPKLTQEVIQAVGQAEQVADAPIKEYVNRWLPSITRIIENMAGEAGQPLPLIDSIKFEVTKELQSQNCSVQFDMGVAVQRIASRLRVLKPVPAPPPCPLSSERPFREPVDEAGPICEICHELLGTGDLFTCTQCRQPQHRECIRGWFKRKTTCPHCRGQCVFDGDLSVEETSQTDF